MSIRSCQTTSKVSRLVFMVVQLIEEDPNSCRTRRVFKLSTIRLQTPLISNTQGSGEALNTKTWLAGGKPKGLFTSTVPPKTVIVFLSYNLPFNTENISFDESLSCPKNPCLLHVLCVCFSLWAWGAGGSPRVTEGWAEICSTQQ